MHLASMVHGSGREREALDHRHLQHHPVPYAPQPHSRAYEPTSVVAPSPYAAHPQSGEYPYHRHPQSPPSPPVEEQKPSLPSISSLLHIADGEKAASETAVPSPKSQQQPSPKVQQAPRRVSAGGVQTVESRPDQASHHFGPAVVSNPRITLPPTPPMQPDSMVDGNQSPSAASNHSSASAAPYYLGQALNNMEPHQQRQSGPSAAPAPKRQSIPSQASMSPYAASAYAASPYASSPGAASNGSYYSPETHPYPPGGMYSQRPLPANFQPQTMPLPVPSASTNGSSVWQHHHYIASSQSAFPPSQDRYICSTCNKAFSRPSSLRIHSHSHTGEKPYKCPQPGCGKAFSVRSNMKRHERGCHASTTAAITAAP